MLDLAAVAVVAGCRDNLENLVGSMLHWDLHILVIAVDRNILHRAGVAVLVLNTHTRAREQWFHKLLKVVLEVILPVEVATQLLLLQKELLHRPLLEGRAPLVSAVKLHQ